MISRTVRVCAVVLCLGLWLGPFFAAVGFAAIPELTLAAEPGGPAAPVTMMVASSDTTATADAYLRSAARVTGVRLSVGPIRDPAGLELVGASVTFTVDGQAQPVAGFKLRKNERSVLVKLTATGLSKDGAFTTKITASGGGDFATLGDLIITRYPSPRLEIDGAEAAALARRSEVPGFDQEFVVRNKSNAAISGALLSFTMYDLNNRQLDTAITIDGAEVQGDTAELGDIDPFGSVPVSVAVQLESVGTYKGVFAVAYEGRRELTNLTVERTHNPPSLALTGTVPTGKSEGIWGLGGDTVIDVALHETGGKTFVLNDPLVVLSREDGETGDQVHPREIVVSRADGKSDWTVTPDGDLHLAVSINGLKDPGRYNGVLSLVQEGAGRFEVTFALDQRAPLLVAALLILVGVVGSAFLRYWVAAGGARSRRQRDVALVQRALYDVARGYGLSADEALLTSQLAREMNNLANDAESDRPGFAQALADLSTRVNLVRPLVLARAGIETIKPPDLVQPLLALLTPIRHAVQSPGRGKAAQELFDKLQGEVNKAWRERVQTEASTTKDAVETLLGDKGKALAAELELVIADDESSAEGLLSRLESLRTRFVHALVGDLAGQVRGQSAPTWMSRQSWDDTVARTLADLDRVFTTNDYLTAVSRYRDAHRHYLLTVARALQTDAEAKDKAVFGPIAEKAKAAHRHASTGDLVAARRVLSEAMTAYDDAVKPAPQPNGDRLAVDGGAPADETLAVRRTDLPSGPDATEIQAPPALHRLTDPDRLLSRLDRDIRMRETIISTFAAALAIPTGLVTLYFPNATWGSWEHLLIAAAWGFGLQFGTGSVLDMNALRKKLLGEETSPPAAPS